MTPELTGQDRSPASVRAEAAAWVARLHGSSRSLEVEMGFQRWLASRPEHARAFSLATEAWDLGGAIPSGALPRMAHGHRARMAAFYFRYGAVLIALCAFAVGLTLYLRDPVFSTGPDEQRMVMLQDGSRISLNIDTRVVVQYRRRVRRVRLERGEAIFQVAKAPERPFIVAAGAEEITALGTEFDVRRDYRKLAVTLVEGKVTVGSTATPSGADGAEVATLTTLRPGERLTFEPLLPAKIDRPSVDSLTAWQRGEVFLDHTRLADAIEEMNRYSAVKLLLSDRAAENIEVSGVFRIGDSLRFARAVAETYHFELDYQPGAILLSVPPDKPK